MDNKKSQAIGITGYRTVVMWVVIIAIGIALFIMIRSAGDTGQTAWEGIKKALPFV